MNIAMILASGVGNRINRDIPKQFIHVNNKPVVIYTLEAFQNHPGIDAVLVVCLDGWHDFLCSYASQYNISKLKWIVSGGVTRDDSIMNGLLKLKNIVHMNDAVLIHDGARPLVSKKIIDDSLNVFDKYGNAVAAIPCVENMITPTDDIKSVKHIVISRNLFRFQTPQTFSLNKLLWAYDQVQIQSIQNPEAIDVLMNTLGETLYISRGSEMNFKITTETDLKLFESLAQTQIYSR